MRAEGLNRRVRIWSAGCSIGQEPLSLAMLFAERDERSGAVSPEIVASDVSEVALARARAGRYSQFEIQRGLPVRRMMRWFDTVGNDWVARPELVRQIAFRQLNLVADPLPLGRFDVILCRNVLLYLSPALRRLVFERLAEVARPGALLVLGAGETVIGQTEAFRPSMRFRGLYEPVITLPAARAAAG
jgi:chemotaxis protein methyltransferase CheR